MCLWKERLSHTQWGGIVLALIGSLGIAWSDMHAPGAQAADQALFGDLLALGGAVMASAYLLCGRLARAHLPLQVYVGGVYSVAALVLLAGCVVFDLPVTGYQPATYLLLVLIACIPQVIGHTIFKLGAGVCVCDLSGVGHSG